MTVRRWAAIALVTIASTGCGAETPDYQSIWSTSPTKTAAPTTQQPVPISKFLEDAGVAGEPVAPDKLTDLTVTLPRPDGWQQYSNPNFAPGTRVIAKGDTYPTAMSKLLMTASMSAASSAALSAYPVRVNCTR